MSFLLSSLPLPENICHSFFMHAETQYLVEQVIAMPKSAFYYPKDSIIRWKSKYERDGFNAEDHPTFRQWCIAAYTRASNSNTKVTAGCHGIHNTVGAPSNLPTTTTITTWDDETLSFFITISMKLCSNRATKCEIQSQLCEAQQQLATLTNQT